MPAVVNETQICNMALSVAGAKTLIGDFGTIEDSEEWRMCNAFLWQVIFEVMSAGPWPFAMTRTELAMDATDPAFGPYDHRYVLPLDVLRIIAQVDEDDDETTYEYKKEGGYLLTSEDTCFIRYIQKVETLERFPPLFITAVYTRLATVIRNRLRGADDWYLRLYRDYKEVLQDALGNCLQEAYEDSGNNDIIEAADE